LLFQAAYLLFRRAATAFALTTATLFVLGAFAIELSPSPDLSAPSISQITDGRDVQVTAHVIAEGVIREEPPDRLYQRVDIETEHVAIDDHDQQTCSRIRVSFYGTRFEQNAG
jgi:hypothetical protein